MVVLFTCLLLGTGITSGHAYPRPGLTERASVGNGGVQGQEQTPPWGTETTSQSSDLTPDGRVVAFSSLHGNLVADDGNLAKDIFVHDRKNRLTQRVSVSDTGTEAVAGRTACLADVTESALDMESIEPSISANGRFIAFTSSAANLVSGDTNLAPDIFVHDRIRHSTVRISVTSSGDEAEVPIGLNLTPACTLNAHPSISASGRYVSFTSWSDLASEDPNGTRDVFVHDLRTHTTKLVSAAERANHAADGESRDSSISGDGRFVAFTSASTDLVSDDTNGLDDVFVRDLEKGATERVSLSSSGGQGVSMAPGLGGGAQTLNSKWGGRAISSDGRFVVFSSTYPNLVPTDANNHSSSLGLNSSDVFVRDRVAGRTERVSVYSYGGEASIRSLGGSISPDGRFVLFDSSEPFFPGDQDRSDLVADEDDLGGVSDMDVFRYDRLTGHLTWVSLSRDSKEGQGDCGSGGGSLANPTFDDPERRASSLGSAISANGRYATFLSCADNLVGQDTNGAFDTFVRDLGPPIGSTAAAGKDGVSIARPKDAVRYESSRSGILVADDARGDVTLFDSVTPADITEARMAYRSPLNDFYLRIDVASMPIHPSLSKWNLASGIVYGFRFTAAGERYEVRVQGAPGPISHDARFTLYRCTDGCMPIHDLRGGFGTTGDSVVVAMPRDALPSGDLTMSNVEAFTGLGTFGTFRRVTLDNVPLN